MAGGLAGAMDLTEGGCRIGSLAGRRALTGTGTGTRSVAGVRAGARAAHGAAGEGLGHGAGVPSTSNVHPACVEDIF